MRISIILIAALWFPLLLVNAEGVMSTGVLKEVACVAGGASFTVRLEKHYLGPLSSDDDRDEGNSHQLASLRQDACDAYIHVAIDYRTRGKYAIIVTREGSLGGKKILGIKYYENRSGWIPGFGPYTTIFWNQNQETLYWILIPQRKRLQEADIHVLSLDPLKPLDVSCQDVISDPARTSLQPDVLLAKYAFKNVPGNADYIPLWMWRDEVVFDYDLVMNELKIGLVDYGVDGGTLTVSYNIPSGTWKRSFAPSQMRLERKKVREE